MDPLESETFQKKLFRCTDDDLKIYYEEYKLTKNNTDEVLQNIKDWYDKQHHLPKDAFDDRVLLSIYFWSKASMEKTKERIENHITIRTTVPEFFTNRDPMSRDFFNSFKVAPAAFMPDLTDKFYRVLCLCFSEDKNLKFNLTEGYKGLFMFQEIRLKYDVMLGDITIMDMKNMRLEHLASPSLLKKVIFIAKNAYGFRFKGVYLVNLPPFAVGTLALLKTILNKKMADRLHVCSSFEELHASIDPKYLPVEFGGPKYTIKQCTENTIEVLQSEYWVNYFKSTEKQVADESKRLEGSTNKYDEMTGMMGSFRKLDID